MTPLYSEGEVIKEVEHKYYASLDEISLFKLFVVTKINTANNTYELRNLDDGDIKFLDIAEGNEEWEYVYDLTDSSNNEDFENFYDEQL